MTVYWVESSYDYDFGEGATHYLELNGWVQVGDILFSIEIKNYSDDSSQFIIDKLLLMEAFQNVKLNQL